MFIKGLIAGFFIAEITNIIALSVVLEIILRHKEK
jgi:hypothetical protein